ncbi:MAG: DUF6531 domain-containing protein [Pseudomonadota bacterium]
MRNDLRKMVFSCSTGVETIYARKDRHILCRPGFVIKFGPNDALYCVRPLEDCTSCETPAAEKIKATAGNPITVGSGVKIQQQSDYSHPSGLNFTRFYHGFGFYNPRAASDQKTQQFGQVWRSNFDKKVFRISGSAHVIAAMTLPAGNVQYFDTNGKEVFNYRGSKSQLTVTPSGFEYELADRTEIFDVAGNLTRINARNGQVQTLTYSDNTTPVATAPRAGLLIQVADNWGRTLQFKYDGADRVVRMIDPAGGTFTYAYDEPSSIVLAGEQPGSNLTSVTYPDGKKRIYWYNEQNNVAANTYLANALTGITDENGVRFATWRYDTSGRAISSEHAGGVENYTVTYNNALTQSTVRDPLGIIRTYDFQNVGGILKATAQSQPAGAGSSAATTRLSYDASGNLASSLDVNGNRTCHAYDLIRNLQTEKIEGLPNTMTCAAALSASSLVAPARKITTLWNADVALVEKVAEPLHITTFNYDASGNLLSKTVQATADATGVQGFAAAITGPARRWTYTYNNVGQVLTTKGPRTDADDVTTYAYDAQGNLTSVTNALGHVTTLSNYDAHGHAGRITDANGVTTDMSYHPRGWLTSRTVTGAGATETTTYAYDGVGQLTQVTLPDGSAVSYTYDPAHRLTAIADSLGNRIGYTLDAIGNRISEQVRDPNGQLTRQTTRVYDALNRLQQITGSL